MKTADQLKPTFAPIYAAAVYPDLAKVFHRHGYALAVHGSLADDMDLIAVPWRVGYSPHKEVLDEACKELGIKVVGDPEKRPCWRLAYTVSIGYGRCRLDLSFFPHDRGDSDGEASEV